ncbi:MAG: peptidoglycan recognition protein family protein [Oculatellaceae cyanobacterium Prado106]|nr:peptidoglycan recognition protein family protein [Oculatellaceae cyanobacterium Prado106]
MKGWIRSLKFLSMGSVKAQIVKIYTGLRSLNLQSTTLKLIALGLAGLLGVLLLSGIQAIARIDSRSAVASQPSDSVASDGGGFGRYGVDRSSTQRSVSRGKNAASQSPRSAPDNAKAGLALQSDASGMLDFPIPSPDQTTGNQTTGNRTPGNQKEAREPRPSPQPSVQPERPQRNPNVRPSPAASPSASPSPSGDRPAPVASPPPSPLTPITPVFASPNPALMTGNLPSMMNAPADPTNFGDRYATDIFGRPVNNQLLVVLHETVGSASSAVNTIQTRHPNENDQVSYHSIIKQDGTIIYLVTPDKRAFGAGNSVFNGPDGPEAVRTHKDFPPSVNNFAYHISLETPSDGRNAAQTHSGYSDKQYDSLAWLVAWTAVPAERITTHRDVDQSRSRIDPRSFSPQKLSTKLQKYLGSGNSE